MNICRRLAFVVAAGLFVFPGHLTAQVTSLKIGYINAQRLFADSPQLTSANAALQEEFSPRQRDLVAQQESLKEKQEQIQRDLEVMGAEERSNAQRELIKAERELERATEEFSEDLNLRRNEIYGKAQRALGLQIQAFAVQAGYDLIVGEAIYIQADGPLDITQQVLDALQTTGTDEQ